MANNKNTTAIESTLLTNKILELSTRISNANQTTGTGQTKEELIIEATKFLSTFFGQLSDPIYLPTLVIPDSKPNADLYNKDFDTILSDLKILFAELENLGTIALSNFNFMISDTNRLLGKLKGVYSKLGDYILFSQDPTKDSIYYSDSFNNLNRIDFNSKLINSQQGEIDQVQGIVTLPIDKKSQTPIVVTITPVINNSSNGTSGNNFELGAALNNDITNILDNNPDTWFEYEHVVFGKDDSNPLVLDITLNLGDAKVINYIRVNPNNFGTNNQIDIVTIETSLDGKRYVNVKDDIPIAGFQVTDEDNVFSLAPSTSKFAGQGVYSFTPRKAKYVHFAFRQSTPYSIIDNTGIPRSRYAIGIRDIEIAARPYDSTGEVVSTVYESNDAIKKVALTTNQNPISDSELASIEHYVSPDNGSTWSRIQPTTITTDNPNIPLILNFNTLDQNSISTPAPVKSVRYKAILKRDDEGFNSDSSSLIETKVSQTELHQVPTSSPFALRLTYTPIPASITLLDPMFGSRGVDELRYKLAVGTGNPLTIGLPFKNIKKDLSTNIWSAYYDLLPVDPEIVRVNGIVWSRGLLALAIATDQKYELDYVTGSLKFGDGVNGKAVPVGATIDIMFKSERLFPSSDPKHICVLDYPTSNDKNTITVTNRGALTTTSQSLSKNATVHQLSNKNLSGVISFSDQVVFASRVGFTSGLAELTTPGQYYVDQINGIVYSKSPTSASDNTTINYQYTPTTILSENDWEFIENTNFKNISIADSVFTTIEASNIALAPTRSYLVTKHLSLVQGTVTFSGPNVDTYFAKEVPFVDGHSELTHAVSTVESIGQLAAGLVEYSFRMPISANLNFDIKFSNTSIFNTSVANVTLVNVAGEYYVDRASGKVTVFTAASLADAGTVSYYYDDNMKTANGLYSIKYATGEIFCSAAIGPDLYASYHYTDYIVQYNIARFVNTNDFKFDVKTNTLNIAEREILKRININTNKDVTQTNFYQVVFDKVVDNREELQSLQPFFTPVLKDYALKIIPESSLLF